jgi:hypothetical protein
MTVWAKTLKEIGAEAAAASAAVRASNAESSSKGNKSFRPWIVTFALFFLLFQIEQKFFIAPIQAGRYIPPGTWRSKCGTLGFVMGCDNAFFEVGQDGIVNVYNSKQELTMQMKGQVCHNASKDCVDGLVYGQDGRITVGGKAIKAATSFSESASSLSPWPFAEEPKVKVLCADPAFRMFQNIV